MVNDAEMLEHACADAWPPQVERALGGWRLRAAGGFTGRANSALAIGDPDGPVRRALESVCEFAHAHGIEPMVQAILGDAVEDVLASSGWVPHDDHPAGNEVSVLLGPLGRAEEHAPTRVLGTPTPGWWELTVGTTEPTDAQRHVLTGRPPAGFGVAEDGGSTTGAVRGVLVGDVLHVARLAVRPELRRGGLATALMGAIGGWAAGLGATRCALQVSVRNSGALALYERLGFREHHRYRYWVPAAP